MNIQDMKFSDLVALQKEVEHELQSRRSTELANLRREVAEIAARSGFDITELLPLRHRWPTTDATAIRFRSPTNPNHTWTGRGRRPAWLKAMMNGGSDPSALERCRVS